MFTYRPFRVRVCGSLRELTVVPGVGMEVLQISQKFWAGIPMFYPYSHPHPGNSRRAYPYQGLLQTLCTPVAQYPGYGDVRVTIHVYGCGYGHDGYHIPTGYSVSSVRLQYLPVT